MLWGLFIRKANFKRIEAILKKEGFSYTNDTIENLLKGNQKGVRYGNVVLSRNEGGTNYLRFFKVILDGKWRTYNLFRRQVKITEALHKDARFKSPTMSVLRSSFVPPLPYAIFETREDGPGYGFMHDRPESYENFTEQDMRRLAEVLYTFHFSGLETDPSTLKLTRHISSDLLTYSREFNKLFDTSITHKTKEGKIVTQKVEQLLVMYTGKPDIRSRVTQLLSRGFEMVKGSKIKNASYLVHADMQIDNIYRHPNGDFEFLDFEWVGRTDSPIIAIMYDYGNLRARAWSSPAFQKLLDQMMLEVGLKFYPNKEEMIKVGLTLGTLRSSLMMSRYHLDFENTVTKDKRTVEDYLRMFPRTVDSLTEVFV